MRARTEEYAIVARAIITIGDRLLVCRGSRNGRPEHFFHLPGGHVEAGELPVDALIRELREEMGRDVMDVKPVDVFENVYDKGDVTVRETNHVFKVKLFPALIEQPARSAETHLTFEWIPLAETERARVMPPYLATLAKVWGGT